MKKHHALDDEGVVRTIIPFFCAQQLSSYSVRVDLRRKALGSYNEKQTPFTTEAILVSSSVNVHPSCQKKEILSRQKSFSNQFLSDLGGSSMLPIQSW